MNVESLITAHRWIGMGRIDTSGWRQSNAAIARLAAR
jgi:hypothetical protein